MSTWISESGVDVSGHGVMSERGDSWAECAAGNNGIRTVWLELCRTDCETGLTGLNWTD
jgi:hypothetical protein